MTETSHDLARTARLTYAVAIFCVLVATLARMLLNPLVGMSFPFASYFLAVMFMAWYGGLGPSLLTLVLGLPAASYLLNMEESWIAVISRNNLASLGLYLSMGIGLVLLGESLHRAAKQAQQNAADIARSNELLSATLKSIGDAVIATDTKGLITFLNPVAETLTGWKQKEAAGLPLAQVFRTINEHTLSAVDIPVTKVLQEGAVVGLANHTLLISKDGRKVPIDDSGAPIRKGSDGSISGVILVFRDISERKKHEEVIRASEERFSKAFNASPLAMSISRFSDRHFIDANESFLRVTGYAREEILGRNGTEIGIWPSEQERVRVPRIDEAGGSLRNIECHLRLKSGEIHIFLLSAEVIEIGEERCVLSVIEDITEQKRAESALKDREARLRLALESAALGTWDYDPLTEMLTWDNACKAMFGLPPETEISNDVFFAGLHPENKESTRLAIKRALDPASGGGYETEYRVIGLQDGAERWIAARGQAFFDEAGRAVRFTGTVRDITHRKRAEDQIKASLQEKELLLKEVHHRVKNNLQVISSLLNIQSRYISDRQVLEIFKESQNRVRSISFAHEQLYRRSGIEEIEIAKYVQSLADHLFFSYGAELRCIGFKIEIEDLSLEVDTAIPCGLIINELVTNALKYAFPEGMNGEIGIALRSTNEEEFLLVISDNGIGMPRDFDLKTSASLGLRIVKSLVDQLKGRMEMSAGIGTEFRVTFKAMKYRRRV